MLSGAPKDEAALPRPLVWMAKAQAVESPLRHHFRNKGIPAVSGVPFLVEKRHKWKFYGSLE